jgi:Ni/Fe-hydrogenase subunit HybB-like protein
MRVATMNDRARIVKDILWIFVLAGLVAAIFRLLFGLGATTNLSDSVPWGLWKVFNMIAGVALSTSGFTVGLLVYVLRLKQFKTFVKPAILIAFLGYGCSCLALLFDIGLPHRFWHPIFMWNINSFLFEVFWCVLLYFTVTSIELAPTIFEGLKAERLAGIFHAIAFVAVIVGISLSSLHHSSLGSLFLVSPQRLHPLWYTPRLPLLFIISAMGGGILFLVFVKIIWGKIFNPEPVFGSNEKPLKTDIKTLNRSVCSISTRRLPGPEMSTISQLAVIGASIMIIYFILKVFDLLILGKIGLLTTGSSESILYILELAIGVLLPIVLLLNKRINRFPVPVALAGCAAAFGLVLNRLNVGIFGYSSDAGVLYFPSLLEWALGIGVIAAAGLVFFALAEYLPIFYDRPAKSSIVHLFRGSFHSLRQTWNHVLADGLHRITLLGVVILPIAFVIMYPPFRVAESTPAMPSTGMDAQRSILKIDGNHASYLTVFNHADHQRRLGDSTSCINCHHIALPGDYSTPCSQCHRSMYIASNIFNHEKHKLLVAEDKKLSGLISANQACNECHAEEAPKNARSAKKCIECHKENMFLTGLSAIKFKTMYAVSFSDAMHLTCMECHRREAAKLENEDIEKCYTCHKSVVKSQVAQIQEVINN